MALLIVVSTLVSIVVTAPPATAYCASPAHRIFTRTGNAILRQGDRAKIQITDNAIEQAECSGLQFTTVHLEDCAYICGTQVETGYRQSVSDWEWFAEKTLNGELRQLDTGIGINFPGTWELFRIRGVDQGDGTMDYHMGIDRLNGNGWVELLTYNVGWGTGYPMAESEKKGQATAMRSSHRNLMFQKTDGAWSNWASVICVFDEAPGVELAVDRHGWRFLRCRECRRGQLCGGVM